MKKLLSTLIAISAFAGCQREDMFVESEEGQIAFGPEFTAQIEAFGAETKTELSGGNSVVWSEGDQLAIFQGKDVADIYKVVGGTGGTQGKFSLVANGQGTPSVNLGANIAIYPYEDDLACTPQLEDGKVVSYEITGVTIPHTQIYSENSFSDESFIMAAITNGSQDRVLNFRNLCGTLKLQLKGTEKIKTIEIYGNNDEKLSGDATLTIAKGKIPYLTMSESADKTILLDCGEGVQLSEEVPVTFFISVPPIAFEKGFSMVAKDVAGNIARVSTYESNPVERSFIHTMPGISVEPEAPSMICYIRGDKIYVRAKSFTEENDMIYYLKKRQQKSGGILTHNRFFNIASMWTTSPTDPVSNKNRQLWKSSDDDIAPLQIYGHHHAGGNHGYDCVDKLKVAGHGKDISDIGSVWKDEWDKQYVLVFVYDEEYLGFVCMDSDEDRDPMIDGHIHAGRPFRQTKNVKGNTMVHVSGATHTDDISVPDNIIEKSYWETEQLWKGSNHTVLKLYADGIEQDLNIDQDIAAHRIEILAEYDMIYIPSMLEYLMENVGKNDNDSQHSDAIADSYYRLSTRYQFNKNGSVSEYHTYTINKTFELGYGGLVQASKVEEDPYIYTPDTVYDDLIWHNTSNNTDEGSYYMYKPQWRDSNKVPYRYFEFTDAYADKGMCLAYDRSVGWGVNAERIQHVDFAGRYRYDTKKMYPAFISGGTLTAGTTVEGLACRIPLYKYDEDLTAVGWYWLGDDIVLMIDSHKAVNKEITLPDYMNNMQIQLLDKTNSVIFEQTQISECKLRYNTGGNIKDYLVVQLSKI